MMMYVMMVYSLASETQCSYLSYDVIHVIFHPHHLMYYVIAYQSVTYGCMAIRWMVVCPSELDCDSHLRYSLDLRYLTDSCTVLGACYRAVIGGLSIS
jgi:hypothetical protein